MTPYQQLSLLEPDSVGDTVEFDTKEEFMRWMASR